MANFNEELIKNVKSLHANKDDDYFEEKYSFIKYVANIIDSIDKDDIEICNENFEQLNCGFDALYFDEDSNIYNLYIAAYNNENNDNSFLTKEDMDALYLQIYNFVEKTISGKYVVFSESSFTYEIADDIYKNLKQSEIVINIVSNYCIPNNYKKDQTKQIGDFNVSFNTYDLEYFKLRFKNLLNDNSILNCIENFGEDISALFLSKNVDFDVYLFGMKGTWLAELYKNDSARLLEPNVRSYLKRTSKVNSGILDTVKNAPEEFVSFNNGVSAVATDILFNNQGKINSITNFQIVNGGQTTATLYECLKDKLEDKLKEVIVPVKLTVVKNIANSSTLIRDISVYSNTQTAIKKSDPPSNLPFYIDFKKLSKECLSNDGGNDYICYFERTSGEYETELKRNNGAKRFTNFNPKNRKFDKIDLARAINCWEQHPNVTCQGKEKNFAYFNNIVKNQLVSPDKDYFKNAYAAVILYKKIDVLAKKLGVTVRSNVVAYTVSYISYKHDKCLDFNEIWFKKDITNYLIDLGMMIIPKIHEVIINAPVTCPEPRMWARKEECWDKVKDIYIDFDFIKSNKKIEFYSKNDAVDYISNQENFSNNTTWAKLLIWDSKHRVYTKKQLGIIKLAKNNIDVKPLTKKQSDYLIDLFVLAVKNGYTYKNNGE